MSTRFHKTPVLTAGIFLAGVFLCAIVNAQTVQKWLQEQRTKNSTSTRTIQSISDTQKLSATSKESNAKSPRAKKLSSAVSPHSASTNFAPKITNSIANSIETSVKNSATPSTNISSKTPPANPANTLQPNQLQLVALIYHTKVSATPATQAIVSRGKASWVLNIGQSLPIIPSSISSSSTKIQTINDDHIVLQKGDQIVSWNIGTVYEE